VLPRSIWPFAQKKKRSSLQTRRIQIASEHDRCAFASGLYERGIAGQWKFIATDGGTPAVDPEFRFVNTTAETVRLEYAFFEVDGTFCGCDRDVLAPRHPDHPRPVRHGTGPASLICPIDRLRQTITQSS
jgi:hypothetical protein